MLKIVPTFEAILFVFLTSNSEDNGVVGDGTWCYVIGRIQSRTEGSTPVLPADKDGRSSASGCNSADKYPHYLLSVSCLLSRNYTYRERICILNGGILSFNFTLYTVLFPTMDAEQELKVSS